VAARPGAWAVAAILAAGAAWALWSAEPVPPPLEAGSPAPDFSLPRLSEGEPVSLATLRGRVVLVNFWATWCKPCEDEMPAMESLYRALRGEGFELLAVSVDAGDAEVEAFRDRLGISFPILRDPDRRVATRYQSLRFPESWLIRADGVVAARFIGPREWDAPEYAERIRALLGAPAPAAR
jgi:peroxiredoxin